jgi:hypothetical protein
MQWIGAHRPSPGTIFGLAALVVALGGAAIAAIPDSRGIIHACYHEANGKVRIVESSAECRKQERALDWNQQGPAGPPGPPGSSGAAAFDEETSEVSTSSNTPVALGGPSVTVTVPPSGLVSIFARAEIKAVRGPSGGASGAINVTGTKLHPRTFILLDDAPTYTKKWTGGDGLCGLDDDNVGRCGTTNPTHNHWVVLEAAPGRRTFSLVYRTPGPHDDDTASFRNRKLWVMPVG